MYATDLAPRPPTPAMLRYLDAIRRLTAELGYPPTFREIAADAGVCINAVKGTLDGARARGLVTWEPARARTLRIVPQGAIG